MSLWFDLNVNQDTIARVAIRRVSNVGTGALAPDVVSSYEVTLDDKRMGYVDHRYGNGPYFLVGLAMSMINARMSLQGADPTT